jgi:hypothetical protein
MTVYSETLVWSPPAELAALAPYQLLLVEQPEGPRLLGRAVPGERLEIGDNVAIDSVVDGVHLFRKNS